MSMTRVEPEEFDWAAETGPAAEVRRIAAAAAASDGREALNEAAVLTLRNRGLGTGVLFVGGADRAEGFAYLHGLSGSGRPELDLVVAPEARGKGLGTALAEAALAAVDGIPITAWSHGNHPAAARLAARLGYASVRELWLMRRPASTPLPEWRTPDGYTIRPFRPGADDAAFLAVNAAAFAFHPEQGSLDQRGLDERKALDWFDADGFLVGEHEGQLLGFHWTKVHPGDPAYGEVYVIGVDPTAQGTGLGKALLAAGLEHLHRSGLDEVVLYVEADNRSAVQLYASYGFTHAASDTDVLYARSPG
jgi:mycothiol synthase